MAHRQCSECFASAGEERIGEDHESADLLLNEACEGRLEVALAAGTYEMQLDTKRPRRSLCVRDLRLGIDVVVWIDTHADHGGLGCQLAQYLDPLRGQRGGKDHHPGDVAGRPAEAGDDPMLDRVNAAD